MVDSQNNIINSVNYSPEWGAKGTGNTLQINESVWIPAIPTPGKINNTVAIDETVVNDKNDNSSENNQDSDTTKENENNASKISESTHSSTVNLSNYDKKTNLEVDSGRIRYGLINTPVEFKAFSNMEDTKKNVKYQWSFGDADSGGGDSPRHTYYFPGTYNIVLNARYIDEQAVDRTKIHIRKPEVNILLINRGQHVDIMLINQSNFEVNFGYFFFILEIDDNRDMKFNIPSDTIVDPNSEIMIPGEISGFILEDNILQNPINLLLQYSNGKNAAKFELNNQIKFSSEDVVLLNSFIEPNKKQEFNNVINMLENLNLKNLER